MLSKGKGCSDDAAPFECSHASSNDKDAFWEMQCWAVLLLYKHHEVCLPKPRWYNTLHTLAGIACESWAANLYRMSLFWRQQAIVTQNDYMYTPTYPNRKNIVKIWYYNPIGPQSHMQFNVDSYIIMWQMTVLCFRFSSNLRHKMTYKS